MSQPLFSTRRRTIVKGALAAMATPMLAQAKASNGKVNLACVGIGNRAAQVIKALHATGLANVVALCDVDMGAPHTVEILNMFPNVPRFQDFRRMFDGMGKEFE